jgi:hypothetical protein
MAVLSLDDGILSSPDKGLARLPSLPGLGLGGVAGDCRVVGRLRFRGITLDDNNGRRYQSE